MISELNEADSDLLLMNVIIDITPEMEEIDSGQELA